MLTVEHLWLYISWQNIILKIHFVQNHQSFFQNVVFVFSLWKADHKCLYFRVRLFLCIFHAQFAFIVYVVDTETITVSFFKTCTLKPKMQLSWVAKTHKKFYRTILVENLCKRPFRPSGLFSWGIRHSPLRFLLYP